jgi:hypothetical protein
MAMCTYVGPARILLICKCAALSTRASLSAPYNRIMFVLSRALRPIKADRGAVDLMFNQEHNMPSSLFYNWSIQTRTMRAFEQMKKQRSECIL